MDRADIVHDNFLTRLGNLDLPESLSNCTLEQAGLEQETLVDIFTSQVLCRHLDRISRKLQARGEAYYTIGSSGHEGNGAVAAALRPTDMAFLHYRDVAFQIARSRQVPGQTPLWDILLGFCTAKEDPISGGRHKVIGSKALDIPPQTSTIASHLPKAVGAAYSIGLTRKYQPEHRVLPQDGIVICSFGDASLNHSTAQGAINSASWSAYKGASLPLLFLCEDNGIGISTKTPKGWVEATMSNRPALEYFKCNGLDLVETYAVAREAADWVRRNRKPAFLHMSCVRLYGHAGADLQVAYLSKEEIEAEEANDPLLHSARRLIDLNIMTAEEVLDIYQNIGRDTERVAEAVIRRPRLKTADEVMASIIPPKRACMPARVPSEKERTEALGEANVRNIDKPQHMAKLINLGMTDLMLQHQEIIMAGEDIGAKGGVYGVTQGLQKKFGSRRVIDSLLDEQSILGLAIGMAHNGFLPMPEIQFLAYLHNAEDQIRGEAATLSFFSNGQYTNPMIVRIAGLGYQRGFGGHFHNDNSFNVLRDIPGLIVACPSNGHDAAEMLRACVKLARQEQRVIAFLEPIALYMIRDLHDTGDGLWCHPYPQPGGGTEIGFGEVGVDGNGKELAIVTYANGYYLSRQAEKILRQEHGIKLRVIDLRWLMPAPQEALLRATAGCKHILIVDECRRTGSLSEELMTLFSEHNHKSVARLTAEDSFIPTGPSYASTLPSRDGIVNAALSVMGKLKIAKAE